MGYTHSWRRPKNFGSVDITDMYIRLVADVKKIITQAERCGISIGNFDGTNHGPTYDQNSFRFNGYGGLAHETFLWECVPTDTAEWRKDELDTFDFCKTARAPYDAVVTAVLIRVKHIYGENVTISSDGLWDADELLGWHDGRELYETVFDEFAECPMELNKLQETFS